MLSKGTRGSERADAGPDDGFTDKGLHHHGSRYKRFTFLNDINSEKRVLFILLIRARLVFSVLSDSVECR